MGIFVRGVAVLLGIYDMPTSLMFYRDVLGCEIVNTSPPQGNGRFHWALLQLGEAQFMLNTNYETDNERPLQPEQHRNIAHRDTCLYFNCPDVDGAYLELQNKGLRPEAPIVTYYGMKQISIADPDGYKIFFHTAADRQ